jgi:hypothetical protein
VIGSQPVVTIIVKDRIYLPTVSKN